MTTQETFAGNATDPQATPEAQASAATLATQSDQDQVALVVGERAFRTLDDVKTKITNADEHIARIEKENADMRQDYENLKAELENRKTVEETLKTKEGTVLSEDKIAELVEAKINASSQQAAVQENIKLCMDSAKARLGEEFIGDITKTANELGISMHDVDKMAGSNPRLFERTFLSNTAPTTPVPTSQRSTVRTQNFNEAPPSDPLAKPVMQMTQKERVNAVMQALENANKQSN